MPDALRGVKSSAFVPGCGSVVAYRAAQSSDAVSVLVRQVTLVQVRQGTKALCSAQGREQIVVQAGGLVLMPVGLRLMSELGSNDGHYESTVVSFDATLLARVLAFCAESEGDVGGPPRPVDFGSVDSEVGQGPLSFAKNSDVGGLVNALHVRVARGPSFGGHCRMLELKLEELALTLLQSDAHVRAMLMQAACSGQGSVPQRLRQVMTQHVYEPLNLADYALLCGRSLSSLKRDFQSVYGEPIGAWLSRERLGRAAALLQAKGLSVSEVCVECGFGNLSNFIRAFRTAYGTSPKQYQLGSHKR